MSDTKPPPHLVSLADDDKLGLLVVVSLLLAGPGIAKYMEWADFLGSGVLASIIQLPMTIIGTALLLFCIHRLLRPGCRIMLRINHGGLTDFRLSETPFHWEDIHRVARLPSKFGSWLPIILLDVNPAVLHRADGTLWYRLLHFPFQHKNIHRLIILCGSLDSRTDKIITTIEAHLTSKK
jgi:hypothetical protein